MSLLDSKSLIKFRPDIEGLRGIAVLLVCLYHADIDLFRGGFVGVDVFFVISGFLITRVILTELDEKGRICFCRFYAKRIMRLMPAGLVVYVFVFLGSVVILPEMRWPDIAYDLIASTLYVQNFRLAAQSIDYLAQGYALSPLQHFWSLAIEEQFYLIWPLLIIFIFNIFYCRGFFRLSLYFLFLFSFSGSLLFSYLITNESPAEVYFLTHARVWALILGGLLALCEGYLRTSALVSTFLKGVGLMLIFFSAITYSTKSLYPGLLGLVPTVGASLIIISGASWVDRDSIYLLCSYPFRWLGKISYSLYLWHWPFLVFAVSMFGESYKFLAVLCSAIPAWLSYKYVESKFRIGSRVHGSVIRRAYHFMVLGGGIVVLSGFSLMYIFNERVYVGFGVEKSSIRPELLLARQDVPAVYKDGCHGDVVASEPTACIYGIRESSFKVFLIGDSHAAQWQPALDRIAKERGWKLVVYSKSSCPFVLGEIATVKGEYPSCAKWNNSLLEILEREKPNVVVTSMYRNPGVYFDGVLLHGDTYDALLQDWMRKSLVRIHEVVDLLLVINDTPAPNIDVPECVLKNDNYRSACAVDKSKAAPEFYPLLAAMTGLDRAHFADFNGFICPGGVCSPVIGNILVYRDINHLTSTYSLTLSSALSDALDKAIAVCGRKKDGECF